jgi:hypothetical protein
LWKYIAVVIMIENVWWLYGGSGIGAVGCGKVVVVVVVVVVTFLCW